MKICFLFSNFYLVDITGQPAIIFKLAQKASQDQKAFVLSNGLENQILEKDGVKVFLFKGLGNLKSYLLNLPKIIQYLREIQPEILHVHGGLMVIYFWAINKIFKIPMVCSLCETPAVLSSFYQKLLVWILNRTQKTFVTSKHIKKQLIKSGLKAEKVEVVRIGLKENFLSKSPDKVRPCQEILYFGDANKERGFDIILRLAQKLPNLKFKVLLRWQAKNCEKELKKMRLLGNVSVWHQPYPETLKNQILKSKLVVLPYRNLGVKPPLSLLESMALSKCVITSLMKANEEVVKNNENGLMVNFKKLDGVVKKISFLLKNQKKRKKIGQAARRTIRQMYRANEYDKIINFYSYIIY